MIDEAFRQAMAAAVGAANVISDPVRTRTYECDGLTGHRVRPALVVLPGDADQVAAVVQGCHRAGVPFVARGAGTGLSGGALPVADGVLVVLAKMRRILHVDVANRYLVAEPGVTNAAITAEVAPHGLYYAPDPSSQVVCTIGGNVAENSGGVHCLKYGFTTHHVRALEYVSPAGERVQLGSPAPDLPGYDLRGVVVGSEGTLGVVTKVWVRLLRRPATVKTLLAEFDSPKDAGDAVSAITGAGMTPAGMEMMDNLAIQACEEDVHVGLNREAGAVLVVELDGPQAEVSALFDEVVSRCREAGARHVRVAADEAERALIWKGRKAAFAAMGRLSRDYYVQDGVIPRTRLGAVMEQIAELSATSGFRIANVFHAGDGNLHPLVLYDGRIEGQAEAAEQVATRTIELCVEAGGSITGEHGVGSDKACAMPKMFSAEDLQVMLRVREALDPKGLSNPGKLFPTPRLCGERPGPYRPHALEAAGIAERL
jgi:glycolate oxidase